MDNEGFWRSPEEWPEDDPPLPGWVRQDDGSWGEPDPQQLIANETRWTRTAVAVEPEPPRRESRQARADKRAMLLVTGAISAALVLLVGALILISQAGAIDEETPPTATTQDSVIYPAQHERDVRDELREAAARQPAVAAQLLAELPDADEPPAEAEPFDQELWVASDDGCLTISERVLKARSTIPIGYADEMDCVPDIGRWTDRYLATEIRRTIDADVRMLVNPAVAYEAGGWNWSAETRTAFMNDTAHPAMHTVTSADTGHNPRNQGPVHWRPARRSVWCAHAIDWIEVKSRWSLGVDSEERLVLEEMLDTCAEPDSDGADPTTLGDGALPPPAIALIEN